MEWKLRALHRLLSIAMQATVSHFVIVQHMMHAPQYVNNYFVIQNRKWFLQILFLFFCNIFWFNDKEIYFAVAISIGSFVVSIHFL